MASQVSTTNLEIVEVHSYIRGYNAYVEDWDPQLGQCLQLRREPGNPFDEHAVAVLEERELAMYLITWHLHSQCF